MNKINTPNMDREKISFPENKKSMDLKSIKTDKEEGSKNAFRHKL